MAIRICSVEGCSRRAHAKGLCQNCYYREKRIAAGHTARIVLKDRTCTIDNCGRKQYVTDLCKKHYQAKNREANYEATRLWKQNNRDRVAEYDRARSSRKRAHLQGMTEREINLSREYEKIILLDPCVYCGNVSESIDHILAVNKEGSEQWWNKAPACISCNSSKQDTELLQFLLRVG